MDELKEFELLSDTEKIKIMKFYKIFSTAVPGAQLEAKTGSDPLKSVGKQKTLDAWLSKSKGSTDDNSISGVKNPTITEKSESISVPKKNFQDTVNCSDSENLEFRQGNTFNRIETAGFPNTGSMNLENKLIRTDNVKTTSEKTSSRAAKCSSSKTSGRANTSKPDFVKKNPIVLVERLDFTDVAEVNSSPTCSTDSSKNSKLNDESSQQNFLSKPIAEPNKTLAETSTSDVNFNAVEKSPSKVGIAGSTSSNEKNREAYYKLKKLCANHELDLDDIFRAPEFQEMIEKYKSLSGSIVFIGSHKCATTGKVEPTVNFHKSKKKLLEVLSALKTRNN